MWWKGENGSYGFIIFGVSGVLIASIIVMIFGAFVGGVEYILSLIANHIVIGTILMAIIDILLYCAFVVDRNDGKVIILTGGVVYMLLGAIANGVALVSCCAVLRWYLDETFQTDFINTIVLLVIGPIMLLVLGLFPVGCKYLAEVTLLFIDDKGKIQSFWIEMIIYIAITILGIMFSTALVYFLGDDSDRLVYVVQNDFFKSVYKILIEINPLNKLINIL